MNRNYKKRIMTCVLALVTSVTMCMSDPCGNAMAAGVTNMQDGQHATLKAQGNTLRKIADEREIMAVVYLCREYPLREEPSDSAETVRMLSCGQTVTITDYAIGRDGKVWMAVRALCGTQIFTGWMERTRLACSDERFLAWETTENIKSSMPDILKGVEEAGMTDDVAQFPESYRTYLAALKQQHPNWVFVPMLTGLDWKTVIDHELEGGKSLVHKSFPNWTKEGAYDGGNWFYASREVLERYMDPRNSLTEDTVFQFEQLTYNESYHTLEAVRAFLANTFMRSPNLVPGTVMGFAETFYYIGKEEGREVSPFHLAARVLQEQGQGNSPLISGTYPGFEGYYNYFNIGATGTSNEEVIRNGLQYAKNHNWNNGYSSILGGADVISEGYIRKGQDTLYLQKFNVNPSAGNRLYTHQYMQNISAPTTEGKSIKTLYQRASALESTFVFKIPVFENMPQQACAMPQYSTNLVLEIPQGYSGNTVMVDGISYTAEKRNGRLIVPLADTNAKRAKIIRDDSSAVFYKLTYTENHYVAEITDSDSWDFDSTEVFLALPEGVDTNIIWLDGIAYPATKKGNGVTANASNYDTRTAVIYTQQANGRPAHMYVYTLTYDANGYHATLQTAMQDLLSYHGFSVRVKGSNGLRCKTGISEAVREQLSGVGIDGFYIKEYGTLVMEDANRAVYPMICGGDKVICGQSFERQSGEIVKDQFYEKVDGRIIYTGLLTNISKDNYKTTYAFRGYLKLEKDGREFIVYGPVMAQSLYQTAGAVLEAGYYETGCEPEQYLKNILEQAE